MKKGILLGLVVHVILLGMFLPGSGFADEKPMVIAYRGDATTMDPHGRTESTNTMILNHLFSKLVTLGPNNEVEPELAKSWKNVDPNTWEFYLHEGLKFTNGEPVTAAAAKYSLERALNHPKSQYAYMVPDYKELVAVDDHTFRLVLKVPNPEVLFMIQGINIVPPKYYQENDDIYVATHPVGAGPYKFVKWVKDEYLEIVRNDDWPLKKPDFKRVLFKPIPEDATRLAALLSGEIDVCANVPISDIPRIVEYEKTSVVRCRSQRVIYIMFDVYTKEGGPAPEKQPGIPAGKPNPFRDIRVRKAVAHAINVDELIQHVMERSAYPATQLIGSHVNGYNPDIQQPKFDRELSRKLLKEAGYPNGFEADFDAPNNRYINDGLMAEAIAGQLEEVGIKLNVLAVPKAVFFPKIGRYESPMYLAGWSSPSFQASYDKYVRVKTKKYGRNNRGRLNDPELERMLDAANATPDMELRTKRRQACSMRVHEHYYILPLYFQETVTGVSSRIKSDICRFNEQVHAYDFNLAK